MQGERLEEQLKQKRSADLDITGAVKPLWVDAPARLKLNEGEAHVWRASLDQPRGTIERLLTLLSQDELERAERFYRPLHRDNYVVARGVLRSIISRYLSFPPASLHFTYSYYGKPSLSPEENHYGLSFNLSHAGQLALYAFTRGLAVGIDVELLREEFASIEIAERFFAAEEVATLKSLPDEIQTRAFFNCWSRKEAYIKALGEGLSHPLHDFTVAFSPHSEAALVAVRNGPAELSRWKIYDLPAGDHYAAALVIEHPSPTLKHWQWTE
jgi:4'-phosphopantetheinyl transferase